MTYPAVANTPRPNAPTQDSDGTTYAYDANGNLLAKTLGSGQTVQYVYDAANRLTEVISQTTSGSVSTLMAYDGQGRLVSRQVVAPGSASDHFTLYAGDHYQVETSLVSTTTLRDYSWTFDDGFEGWEKASYSYAEIEWLSEGFIRLPTSDWPSHATIRYLAYLGDKTDDTTISFSYKYQTSNCRYSDLRIRNKHLGGAAISIRLTENIDSFIRRSYPFTRVHYGSARNIENLQFELATNYIFTSCEADLYLDEIELTDVKTTFDLPLITSIQKHYYANGQRIASRTDDDLTYYLSDPSGSSLILADEAGHKRGHVLYDPFGGILSHILSLSDNALLADQLPDPSTGLVHLGDGRWYDPRLGRPLQPKAQGGLSTVPQSLNPYAVTAFGQPGVSQAAQNNGSFLATLTPILLANTPGGVAGDFAQIALQAQIIGTKSALGKALRSIDVQTVLGPEGVARVGTLTSQSLRELGKSKGTKFTETGQVRVTDSFDEAVELQLQQFQVGQATVSWQVLKQNPLQRGRYLLAKYPLAAGIRIDVVAGLAFEILYQDSNHWSNPHLSGGQKFAITGIGVGAAAGVSAATYFTVAAFELTGPIAWGVTIGVATVYSFVAGEGVSRLLDTFFSPPTDIQPLRGRTE